MLTCRMATVTRPDGLVEWRVAPDQEPLASCALVWPADYTPAAPPWAPPALHGAAHLFDLTGPDGGRLRVHVMRYGVEVDGFEALRGWLAEHAPETPLTDPRWTGLPLVEARAGETRWAVVHAGPALFVMQADGPARRWLPRAARSLRSLAGEPIEAEALVSFDVGPLRTRRLAAWRLGERLRAPHGHHRATLLLDAPTGQALARLELLVVDRRVHPGLDPHVLLAAADGRLATLGVRPGERALDPGPSGPARSGPVQAGQTEHRRVLRQVGRSLVVIDGLWRRDAAVARLNGRRHQDVLLACAAG